MSASQKPPVKIVKTDCGELRGFAPNDKTWAWYGVAYARPPVGALRWKPPVAVAAWQGVRDARKYGDQAAQNPAFKPYGMGGMSEDCLYLNITTPRNAQNQPVMVWLHGGAFMVLSSNMNAYNNPEALPTKGVVLVTVGHRLGPFGYLAHPLLSAESDYGGSGNYGQMDLIAALQWVQKNIAAFGGNPDNITIFGQSGGGAKALSLMASPLAKGLFKRAMCLSGMVKSDSAFMNTCDLKTAEAKGTKLFKRLGRDTLAEMRAVSWEKIVTSDLSEYRDKIGVYGPNVDGHYAQQPLLEAVTSGLVNDVPLVAGANVLDLVAEADLVPGLIEQMPLRSAHCKALQYAYQFSHVPAGWRELGGKAYHSIELVYLFNFPASFVAHFLLGLTGLTPQQIGDRDGNGTVADARDIYLSTKFGAEDMMLTDKVMTLWTNYAKSGDPGIPGVIDWKPYSKNGEQYLSIGSSIEMRNGLGKAFV